LSDILPLIGREQEVFIKDIENNSQELNELIKGSSILVIGGAGSIGQATVKELFKRSPKKLYVVDLSENNLAELVRDIRSSIGYIEGDFKTFAIGSQSPEFGLFFSNEGPFDYILNLSALKHVRSEKDPYTLMRMIQVNNISIADTLKSAAVQSGRKYFAVSTDKAANPVNLMGATKRVMEKILFAYSDKMNVSSARFANVAFSDGSLLHAFNMRIMKNQPIAAPSDVKRYFVTPEESGRLCMMSAMLGDNRDIFFPQLDTELHMLDFKSIAERYLENRGLEAYPCDSEEEARQMVKSLKKVNKWPCYFSSSNTTGEKLYEEFFTPEEQVDGERFSEIGIVKNIAQNRELVEEYINSIKSLVRAGKWSKQDLISKIELLVPELIHEEKGFYLDGKM